MDGMIEIPYRAGVILGDTIAHDGMHVVFSVGCEGTLYEALAIVEKIGFDYYMDVRQNGGKIAVLAGNSVDVKSLERL